MKLTLGHHRDEQVEGFLGDTVDLLYVEKRSLPEGAHERPIYENLGVVTIGEHPGRVEVAHKTGRGELCVAFHELESEFGFLCDGTQDGRLAGTRRSLQQDVAVGRQRGHHHFHLFFPPHHVPLQSVEKLPVKA